MPIERFPFDPDTDREAWLAERLKYVNASEMAIVCGQGAWGSLAELYAEKKGLRPSQVDSAVLRRGRWGEDAVFRAMREERPEWNLLKAKVHVRDTDRRMACTPDGFATARDRDGIGIVQCKVIARSIFRQKWLDDPDPAADIMGPATPPAHYRIQTITETMLNGLKWGVLAVIINGEHTWEFRLLDVPRDDEIEQSIVDNTAAFWRDYFDPGIMPPYDPQRDDRLIKALYPRDDGSAIDLSGDNRVMVATEDLVAKKAGMKNLKDEIGALETELKGKLGEHSFGLLADGRCLSWRHQHRKAYSVAATDFRVLRVLNQAPEIKDD